MPIYPEITCSGAASSSQSTASTEPSLDSEEPRTNALGSHMPGNTKEPSAAQGSQQLAAAEQEQEARTEAEMTELLGELRQQFERKSAIYKEVERKWRTRCFEVACLLGMLPVLAGMTHLLPSVFAAWFALFISVFNVVIVVINVKFDMGERIADAGMARKGYERLALTIQHFLVNLKMTPAADRPSDSTSRLLLEIRVIQEQIEANMTYPEVSKLKEVDSESGVLDSAETVLPKGAALPFLPLNVRKRYQQTAPSQEGAPVECNATEAVGPDKPREVGPGVQRPEGGIVHSGLVMLA